VLAAVRCRADQGYMLTAVDLLRSARPEVIATTTLRLWAGFVDLHLQSDQPFTERAAAFSALCDESVDQGGNGPAVRALVADLRSRAEVMRSVLSGMGPGRRGELVSAMVAAADGYRSAGQPREALATLRRAAAFAAGGLRADRETARELYLRASREADAGGLVIARAQAELALAEFELRALLDGSGASDHARVLSRFDELAAAFAEGGHAFGNALVHWAAARLLLEYGSLAGVELARGAAAVFAAADAPSSELQVWSTLRIWYSVHGDEEHGREAERRAARLAPGLGFSLAAEVRVLDEANQAFRSGEVARARALLTGLASGSSGLQAASRLMLATSAVAVGMKAEARRLLEDVIADMKASGASLVLGEALTVLATLLMGEDDARVLDLLRAAAAVARAGESPVEEAKYRSQLAWTMVTQRMAAQARPLLNDDVSAEFEAAERLLAGPRTLAAGSELARLYQYRGQAAFFDTDWPQVGTWLTKAESVTRGLGLLPDLAFILSYQGLAMIQLARRSGTAAYDQAARLFAEAQELFRRVSVPAFVWQTGFYRALCDIEAARWPGTADAERGVRLDRASRLMEESSGLIDQLRESSESGDAAREQQVWMAFSVDKQTFYGQGFGLAWDARADAAEAWRWLERMKGRALLDGLSDAGVGKRRAARQSEPPEYAEIRDLLAAEEAAAGGKRIVVAEYLCTPERTMVFGARADWGAPRQAYVPLDHGALRRFTAATFRQPGGVWMMMEDLGPAGLRQWARFAPLLAPLAEWTAPGDVVYLVPYGVLHDLPLHTLPLNGEPLIERNPVCFAPASAVLRHTLRGGGPGFTGGTAAVFGDSRGDLPAAREEAATVATLLGVTPLTGGDVTREKVTDAFRSRTTVHFAGHGQLSTADGFASGLDLAGTDVLRAGDMLGQPCATRLAVLSGCDTGVSELRPGDEAVGLIRALLLSGVRSILASQWQVSDASTRDLLCRLHEAAREAGVSPAEALQCAVRAIRRDPRYAHLYHWGSFALVGSWR
jgi:CHAT domain